MVRKAESIFLKYTSALTELKRVVQITQNNVNFCQENNFNYAYNWTKKLLRATNRHYHRYISSDGLHLLTQTTSLRNWMESPLQQVFKPSLRLWLFSSYVSMKPRERTWTPPSYVFALRLKKYTVAEWFTGVINNCMPMFCLFPMDILLNPCSYYVRIDTCQK